MKELEKRNCIIKPCSNTFKVFPESKIVACSNFCLEQINGKSKLQNARKRHVPHDRSRVKK